MVDKFLSQSQVSRHSIQDTLREIRLANQVNKLQRELNSAMKALESAETERDGLGEQLDCALGLLDEAVNYIGSAFATAHELGVVTEIPQILVAATEFLAEQDVAQEKVGQSE